MNKLLSIFKINTIGKAVSLIIVFVTFTLFLIIGFSRLNRLEIDLSIRKEKLIEKKKDNLKNLVDIAFKTIESSYEKSKDENEIKLIVGDKLEQTTNVLLSVINTYYLQNKNSLSDEQLKNNIKQLVKKYKGTNNEYFWITDNSLPYPIMIMHPNSPQLDGSVLNNPKFNCAMEKNQNLFQAMVQVCNASGSGFVNYIWDKPTNEGVKPNQPKLSFVKNFKPYNWVIGTGVYIDDIEKNIKNECLSVLSKMRYNNGTGYYWITDNTLPYPKMIMHATSPNLNNTVLDNSKYNCAMGKNQNLFQAMIEITNKFEDGFVDYVWDKPTKNGVLNDVQKISYVKKFDNWNWVVGTGIYLDEVKNEIDLLRSDAYNGLVTQLGGLIFAFFVMYLILYFYIKRVIIQPVKRIQSVLNSLSNGVFPKPLKTNSENEIGQITKSTNVLITNLTNVKDFAYEVGKGNLDTDFNSLSVDDELGVSLIDMRENLIIARAEEEKRKNEDDQRNWATQGLAKFAEILRNNNDNIESLSYSIISNLVNYLGANQGGFFLLYNNEENNKESIFKLEACYAYNRKKYLEKNIEWGEGLIGRCGLERQTIFMTDIPSDYITITSGLGDANPTSLLLIPLILNEEIFGVIEIASFKQFEKYQVEFVEKVGESIASTISSVQVNNKTKYLLEQSQQQTEEMKAQEEEMRQNLEEMQATQEEMARAKADAEIAMNNLNSIKNPIISIDPDFNITYINEVGCKVSGVSKEHALTKKCYDLFKNTHCGTEECRCAMAMKNKKAETGNTIIEATNTEIVYTGTPIIDDDGLVTGAVEQIIQIGEIKKYIN